VTKENENMLYDHQMLDTIGKMSVYGQVQYNDEYAGNIGVVDDFFYGLSNISLKTGKLPSNAEEVAVEAYILDGLGIDYTLDQNITLSIQSGDQIFEKEYRLCGILDNYSATWINQGSLVNFFIQEDDSFSIQQTNIFILPLENYFDVMDEIILKDENHFVYNDSVEFVYDPFSRQNLPYTILAYFAIIYTLLLITYTFYNWTNQHTKEIQMFRSQLIHVVYGFLKTFIKGIDYTYNDIWNLLYLVFDLSNHDRCFFIGLLDSTDFSQYYLFSSNPKSPFKYQFIFKSGNGCKKSDSSEI